MPRADGGGGITLAVSAEFDPPEALRDVEETPSEETFGGGGATSCVPKSFPTMLLRSDPLAVCVGGENYSAPRASGAVSGTSSRGERDHLASVPVERESPSTGMQPVRNAFGLCTVVRRCPCRGERIGGSVNERQRFAHRGLRPDRRYAYRRAGRARWLRSIGSACRASMLSACFARGLGTEESLWQPCADPGHPPGRRPLPRLRHSFSRPISRPTAASSASSISCRCPNAGDRVELLRLVQGLEGRSRCAWTSPCASITARRPVGARGR